jgi:tetratricopeptide (TPR) repeat protein
MRTRALPLVLLVSALAAAACKTTIPPGAASSDQATAMGDWASWQDLTPLVNVAKTHASKGTIEALTEASSLLRDGKAKTADAGLAELANTTGRDWITVARADLAALYFSVCIRGVALRLEDEPPAALTRRRMDFSPEARIEPGDVSIEAMLTNLDLALESEVAALVTQARIARARVAAFASRCAANDEVEAIARGVLENDLATLAARGHLTPDLAFLWAGVQMNKYSGAAATPFLLQAIEGGFDDPSAVYMLAMIALEQRELDRADALARQALAAYTELGDDIQVSETHFLRGEIARAKKDAKAARRHYDAALEGAPAHVPAILASVKVIRDHSGEDAARDYLGGALARLLLDGSLSGERLRAAAANLERLVMLADDPHAALLCRDTLVADIDSETDAVRRGLRYFYAATLDAALGEYELARGRAALAKEEFADADMPPPMDIEAFLTRLHSAP